MGRVAEPLRVLGADVETSDGHPPLVVTGASLSGTTLRSRVASAQVKSAVLLAGLFASGTTEFVEPAPSRDHTERMLARMGADIVTSPAGIRLRGGRRLAPLDVDVPADPSAAAFYVVAACLAAGSDIMIRGVGVNPTRAGFLDVLRRMGAKIAVMNERDAGGEPVADLRVEAGPLRAAAIAECDVPSLVDEVPILAIAAAAATGTTQIRGAAELRVKESDRLRAMAVGLRRLGVDVTEYEDGLDIVGRGTGGFGARGETVDIDGRGDHRIAMSFRVAALLTDGGVRVLGQDAAAISDPGFETALTRLAAG
jgi:3-phosphoshikimate 1-carboxyvinyltransferase